MYGILKEMYRIKIIRFLRVAGIPYKCKANFKRILKAVILMLFVIGIEIYVFINEPIYAKKNLLLMIDTNLHLIFLFMVLCGIFVSINWMRYDEYDEIQFLLSLPLYKEQIYKYKVYSLLIEWVAFITLIMLPFCIDLYAVIRIGAYIVISIGGLLFGIGIGAKVLCLFQQSFKVIFVCILFVLMILVCGFKYTRYSWRIENDFILYLLGIFSIGIAFNIVVRNFYGLYSDLLYRKKRIGGEKATSISGIVKNKVLAFVIKDYISFSRNKRDLFKTMILLGCFLISIRLTGFEVKIAYQYLLPYIGCNIWILDLAGQETYFYQINKLLKNGSSCDYYLKRLLSGFVVVLPISVICISFFEQIYVISISILMIFLSVGISILCKRESISKYNASFGVNVAGQLIYYTVGAAYMFLFEMVLRGSKIATILFCITMGINIYINLYVVIKGRCKYRKVR